MSIYFTRFAFKKKNSILSANPVYVNCVTLSKGKFGSASLSNVLFGVLFGAQISPERFCYVNHDVLIHLILVYSLPSSLSKVDKASRGIFILISTICCSYRYYQTHTNQFHEYGYSTRLQCTGSGSCKGNHCVHNNWSFKGCLHTNTVQCFQLKTRLYSSLYQNVIGAFFCKSP